MPKRQWLRPYRRLGAVPSRWATPPRDRSRPPENREALEKPGTPDRRESWYAPHNGETRHNDGRCDYATDRAYPSPLYGALVEYSMSSGRILQQL